MSQCLYCNKACEEPSVFCEDCKTSLLVNYLPQLGNAVSPSLSSTSPTQAASPDAVKQAQANYRYQKSYLQDVAALEPVPESVLSPQETPMPEDEQEVDLGQLLPNDWLDLEYADEDEDSDSFMRKVDPLLERRPPYYGRMAAAERQGALFTPRRDRAKRLRMALIAFIGVVLIAVILDTALIALSFNRHSDGKTTSSPALTVLPHAARPGQIVLLHLSHFTASTHVFLTHDIQEMVRTDTNSPLIAVDASGSADVHMLVEQDWGPGEHPIEAEDVTTHYTTSTTLEVIGGGIAAQTRLIVSQTMLNMGTDIEGANTVKSLTFQNGGGGSILWTAKSDQGWLTLTPSQGTFSASQSISVAVTRANLQPGSNYSGTLTISSNGGSPVVVQVKMTVLPLPNNVGAVLELTPPTLSFAATDGGPNPVPQMLTLSNPGKQPLSWSNAGVTPTNTAGQGTFPLSNGNWLSTLPTSGTLTAGATAQIEVLVQSQSLLQGVYSDTLTVKASNALNSPQYVVVSINVQPSLSPSPTPPGQATATVSPTKGSPVPDPGTATATATTPPSSGSGAMDIFGGNLNFSYTQGQSSPASQSVTIANIGGSPFSWQASFSASSWLNVAPNKGTVGATQSSPLAVNVHVAQLAPATYSTQLTISATDGSGKQVQGSPRTINVTLTVSAPCSLQVTPTSLSFSASLLQPHPAGQSLTIKETGSCANPVWWKASVDHAWLSLSSGSGSNNSSLTVSASAQGMLVGKYTAHIAVSATDNNGMDIQNSPQTVTVTLTVSAL